MPLTVWNEVIYKPKKVEQINNYLFKDTSQKNKYWHEWNEGEMTQRSLVNTRDISPEIA